MMTSEQIAEIRAALEGAAPDGQEWFPEWESCDCGDGYGCPHGAWITAIHGPVNQSYANRPDDNWAKQAYGRQVTEISELPSEASEFVVRAPRYVRLLLAEVERQRDRAKFFERASARVTRDINLLADMHEQCDVSTAVPDDVPYGQNDSSPTGACTCTIAAPDPNCPYVKGQL